MATGYPGLYVSLFIGTDNLRQAGRDEHMGVGIANSIHDSTNQARANMQGEVNPK
jgi:hypothetical protein